MLTIGSLFSGIGGLELGLEWAGLGPTKWQVEQDGFATRVLARHWPDAKRFDDVCAVGASCLEPVDLICGGFPCQDLSFAGKGAGLSGARSGLWREFARIIGELRPSYVVVENVPALLSRGLGTALGDLAALGFDAWWDCLPAAAVGASHRRDRFFLVAYACGGELQRRREPGILACSTGSPKGQGNERQRLRDSSWHGHQTLANASSQRGRTPRADRGESCRTGWLSRGRQQPSALANSNGQYGDDAGHGAGSLCGERRHSTCLQRGVGQHGSSADRNPEPSMGRVADGLSAWLDRGWPSGPGEPQKDWEAPRVAQGVKDRSARLKSLGNAVVPQVGFVVGSVVVEIERHLTGGAS